MLTNNDMRISTIAAKRGVDNDIPGQRQQKQANTNTNTSTNIHNRQPWKQQSWQHRQDREHSAKRRQGLHSQQRLTTNHTINDDSIDTTTILLQTGVPTKPPANNSIDKNGILRTKMALNDTPGTSPMTTTMMKGSTTTTPETSDDNNTKPQVKLRHGQPHQH